MARKNIAYFLPVKPVIDFPALEGETISYWKNHRIFERSISLRNPNKKWTFLDGPPFVTGLPHYGTLLSSIPKDVFGRYWTMKGYCVRRVWGWDGHGLPIENKVEKILKIKSKKEIEDKIGEKKFINECLNYVNQVSSDWQWYIDRIGRWVDFDHAYKTWDLSYMESVLWVFKNIYDKGLIFKGTRISLYCPHCETPLSNFEISMDEDNYREVTEVSNTYKYQLVDDHKTFFLAWSTTPWTKISTTALAVNPKYAYIKVRIGKEFYILEKSALNRLNKKDVEIVSEFSGKSLIGKRFVPHYQFFKIDKNKKAFEIIGADFVTADEGTGIVTIAPYGEEDLEIMTYENIQIYLHVNNDGTIKREVPNWGGMNYLEASPLINQDLAKRNLMFDEQFITHKMPYCWRCQTKLFYNPQNAWFLNIQKIKEKLRKNNLPVNWFPKHFKFGRFLKSMDAAPDWCISRNRYWGSPVPVWECSCHELIVPGSISEIEKLSNVKVMSLHKPDIDNIVLTCPKCGKKAHRVSEVLDSWVEAGSAAFAERHYPFEKNIQLTDFFPPDFIVEYTGQIRAWFYVLHVIASALYDSPAFKNVLVTGVILGSDGRKMSKNYGNFPDPKLMLEKYGGDALRLYLLESAVMRGEDIVISEAQYRNQIKEFLLVLWNIYNFFVSSAISNDWFFDKPIKSENILDKWITVSGNFLMKNVTESLEKYDTAAAITSIKKFVVNDLSGWYIRRSRDRVDLLADNEKDKNYFFGTCYQVLLNLTRIMAPIIPFISEIIYQNLTKKESVHLENWPNIEKYNPDEALIIIRKMELLRKIVEKIHSSRKIHNIPVRQPLASVTVYQPTIPDFSQEYLILAERELNIKNIIFKIGKEKILLDTKITSDLKEEAETRILIRKIQNERKKLALTPKDKIKIESDWIPDKPEFVDYLVKKTGAIQIKSGKQLKVSLAIH